MPFTFLLIQHAIFFGWRESWYFSEEPYFRTAYLSSSSSDKEDFSYKDVVPPLSTNFTVESFVTKPIGAGLQGNKRSGHADWE